MSSLQVLQWVRKLWGGVALGPICHLYSAHKCAPEGTVRAQCTGKYQRIELKSGKGDFLIKLCQPVQKGISIQSELITGLKDVV